MIKALCTLREKAAQTYIVSLHVAVKNMFEDQAFIIEVDKNKKRYIPSFWVDGSNLVKS